MAGYYGYSMSNNAIDAYENGEKPRGKWKKSEIVDAIGAAINSGEICPKCEKIMFYLYGIPAKYLRDLCLRRSSWHHTSSWYNETDFYSIDYDGIERMTEEQIKCYIDNINKKKKVEPTEERWVCHFLVWSGSRNHPKAKECVEEGVIKGNWFYRSNGEKKSINANGFYKVRLVDKDVVK